MLDNAAIVCSYHPSEQVTLYCLECDILACRDCFITVHRNHDCQFIDEIETDFANELANQINGKKIKFIFCQKIFLPIYIVKKLLKRLIADPFLVEYGKFLFFINLWNFHATTKFDVFYSFHFKQYFLWCGYFFYLFKHRFALKNHLSKLNSVIASNWR